VGTKGKADSAGKCWAPKTSVRLHRLQTWSTRRSEGMACRPENDQ